MAFTSYAQNFEDVILWRALKHIENGTYVDVGAQHPTVDSVSKAFYERGWRGIHIEPVPMYAQMLREARPDELVLEVAISDTAGSIELNVIAGTGLSTAVNHYALRHQAEHGHKVQKITVPTMTIMDAIESLRGKDVHWLKVDVEGLETKVLNGWDHEALRPWIMVIEATIPNSKGIDVSGWEAIVASANYDLVYFDGLNRYYLASEHSDLKPAFSAPPNVFDDIRLTHNSSMLQGLGVHSESMLAAEAMEQITKMQLQIASLDAELWTIKNSKSWRIMKPFRLAPLLVASLVRVFKNNTLECAIKKILNVSSIHALLWIRTRPRIVKIIIFISLFVPVLKVSGQTPRKTEPSPGANVAAQLKDDLSERAFEIYNKLESRLKRRET